MASTILYKFRSGTSFEPLPLPGTSARLFDIKKAIVNAKKLNSSSSNTSLEFDLSIQNATTNEVYDDESMILPRGTRIVVRRVAAERGRGILSRMAMGGLGAHVGASSTNNNAVKDGFYTIRSRDRETEDEFLDAAAAVPPPPQATTTEVDESAELEALKAVTDQAGGFGHYGPSSVISGGGGDLTSKRAARDPRIAGQGMPPPQFAKPPPFHHPNNNNRYRPNADPELRQQELMSMPQPKKRATGIPRTFLNLNAPTTGPEDGGGEGGANYGGETSGEGGTGEGGGGSDLATQLQPSAQAFQALVKSGGGQSLSSSSKRRDLDYALKLTATSIPDHLQCGICSNIVKNAMLVPWDTEGRPTCESCIRDGLTKNGFTCPLTGIEGVSPDDLFPNVGLRKAADMFVKDVMDKLDSIERQIEAEEEEEEKKRIEREKAALDAKGNDVFEDGGDGILTKRTKLNGGSKKSNNTNSDDLLFGGDDEFGGDVFDVVGDDEEEPEDTDEGIGDNTTIIEPADNTKTVAKKDGTDDSPTKTDPAVAEGDGETAMSTKNNEDNNDQQNNTGNSNFLSQKSDGTDATAADDQQSKNDEDDTGSTSSPSKTSAPSSRSSSAQKETKRVRRAPPAGYVLGPAGSGGMVRRCLQQDVCI